MPLNPFPSNLLRSLRHASKHKPPTKPAPKRCPVCKQPQRLRWRDYVLEEYDSCRFLKHQLAVEEAPLIPTAELDLSYSVPTGSSPTLQPRSFPSTSAPNFYLQLSNEWSHSFLSHTLGPYRLVPARVHAFSPARSPTPQSRRFLTTTPTPTPTPISTSTYHT